MTMQHSSRVVAAIAVAIVAMASLAAAEVGAPDRVADLEQKLDALLPVVENLSRRMTELQSELDELKKPTAGADVVRVRERISTIESQLGRLAALDAQLRSLSHALAEQSARLQQVEQKSSPLSAAPRKRADSPASGPLPQRPKSSSAPAGPKGTSAREINPALPSTRQSPRMFVVLSPLGEPLYCVTQSVSSSGAVTIETGSICWPAANCAVPFSVDPGFPPFCPVPVYSSVCPRHP